jgi:hypothetical protein
MFFLLVSCNRFTTREFYALRNESSYKVKTPALQLDKISALKSIWSFLSWLHNHLLVLKQWEMNARSTFCRILQCIRSFLSISVGLIQTTQWLNKFPKFKDLLIHKPFMMPERFISIDVTECMDECICMPKVSMIQKICGIFYLLIGPGKWSEWM